MILKDIKAAIDLSTTEGWNQTEKDWRLLLDNPLNTCLVAESEKKIFGTATAINYSNLAGWIGMVLVGKEFRRQGIGRLLVENIIEKLNSFKSIKLDATPAGQPVYQKLGFVEESTIYRMTNYSFTRIDKERNDSTIEPVKNIDLKEIFELDRSIFGTDRTYLLNTIIHNYPGKAFQLKRNGKISGFILGRDGLRFNYIGSVFAHTTTDAEALISKVLESLSDQPVALDVHEDKKELIEWLESIGFIRQRQFVRMYLKNNPYPGKVENQFLIIGPEFG